MAGNYSHTTRADGLILTAAIYNADHVNHITFSTPAGLDDYSVSVAQMKENTDPGESGSESLATSTAEELKRLRFAIKEMKFGAVAREWYETAANDLETVLSNVSEDSVIGLQTFS